MAGYAPYAISKHIFNLYLGRFVELHVQIPDAVTKTLLLVKATCQILDTPDRKQIGGVRRAVKLMTTKREAACARR